MKAAADVAMGALPLLVVLQGGRVAAGGLCDGPRARPSEGCCQGV